MKNITILLISLAIFNVTAGYADNKSDIKTLLDETFNIPSTTRQFVSKLENKFDAIASFFTKKPIEQKPIYSDKQVAFCGKGKAFSGSIRSGAGVNCLGKLRATVALYVCPWFLKDDNNLFSAKDTPDSPEHITKCGYAVALSFGIYKQPTDLESFVSALKKVKEAITYENFESSSPTEVCIFIKSVSLSAGSRRFDNIKELNL